MSLQQNTPAAREASQANLVVLSNVVEMTRQVLQKVAGDTMPALPAGADTNAQVCDLVVSTLSSELIEKGA